MQHHNSRMRSRPRRLMLLHLDRNRPAPIANHAKRDAIPASPSAKTTKKPNSHQDGRDDE
jgi:hypothetical protein